MERVEFLVHSLLLAHHCFAVFYLDVYVDLTQSKHIALLDMQTYRYRYFTTWNFTLQIFYLVMMVSSHIMKILPQTKHLISVQKALSTIRGYLYTTFVFPVGILVSGIFWIVFTINRELIFPKVVDEFMPSWINHSIHTNILLLLFAELFFYKKLPTFKDAAKGALVFFLGYSINFFFTFYQTSRWLYGIFGVFSWPERLFFMLSNYLIALISIKLCIFIQTNVQKRKLPNSNHHKVISKKLL